MKRSDQVALVACMCAVALGWAFGYVHHRHVAGEEDPSSGSSAIPEAVTVSPTTKTAATRKQSEWLGAIGTACEAAGKTWTANADRSYTCGFTSPYEQIDPEYIKREDIRPRSRACIETGRVPISSVVHSDGVESIEFRCVPDELARPR